MSPALTLSEFISAKALIEHLAVTRAVLASWMNRGLPYIRVGRSLYFREASVAGWLGTQERTRDPESPRTTPEGGSKQPQGPRKDR